MPDLKGVFSVSSAKELVRNKFPKVERASLIWRKEIHPVLAAQNWKFLRGICATHDLIKERFKIPIASRCCLCGIEEETLDHATSGRSQMVWELWLLANLVFKSELWALRNKGVFEQKKLYWNVFLKSVLKRVKWQQPKEYFWHPRESNEILLYCDGSARGNPGRAGAGVVARDASCNVIGAMSIGLGITTNYLAELYGIIIGLEWATRWGVRRICIRSDSSSMVEALNNSCLPWFARRRWLEVCRHYNSIRFIHTYREANFAEDVMEKRLLS
ncbi:uncharacterized protein LOC113356634 [Papaver somniferum]|uniref:uncharacterized protein LOC113356634 n=1 Tax=Papaver somniferum TaxID=3469 RepID=UPI000E7020FC|nr:uncharacterized protein LOC113356634 [Papaver somniferum]